jgi:hypothetical protein
MFHDLKIGEVIPATSPSMDIYNYGFAPSEIGRLLGMNNYIEDKEYRAVINYYSFTSMVGILMNSQGKEYCVKFTNSLKTVFTDVNPNTFWINVLVTETTAKYLKENEIGEVIVKEGSSGESAILELTRGMKEPAVWNEVEVKQKNKPSVSKMGGIEVKQKNQSSVSMIDEFEELYDFSEMTINNESKTETKNDASKAMLALPARASDINLEQSSKLTHRKGYKMCFASFSYDQGPTPYRLVMNNKTLLNLITYSCYINGTTHDQTDVFQLMGGEDDKFSDLFGMLQI